MQNIKTFTENMNVFSIILWIRKRNRVVILLLICNILLTREFSLMAHESDKEYHHQNHLSRINLESALDWKIHDVGMVRQVVTNIGGINASTGSYDPILDYPFLMNCEYPPNSQEEHIFEAGIRIGAIVNGDTMVSIPNWNNAHQDYEYFPTGASYDTIWVATQGDTLDIPYWPNYVAISEQDFICRYSDYNITDIPLHTPLYLDVIQTSHAWSSYPFDKIIVYNYYVIPTRNNLQGAYVTYMMQGRVGNLQTGQLATDDDDVSMFVSEHNMAVIKDLPGGPDGTATSPVAIKIYPPEEWTDSLDWSFKWYGHHHQTPMRDKLIYEQQMVSNSIMQDQAEGGQSIFALTFGPFDLMVGDTIHFSAIEILGDGMDEIMKTAERLDILIEKDFKLPVAPPTPPLTFEIKSNKIILDWEPTSDDQNPELYTDPNRADSVEYPFEGYRVYKSTNNITGPWTLLAEYDLPANDIGSNIGLSYEFNDIGLLDYFEYFYSVTAYSREDSVLGFPELESSINRNAISVVPGPSPQPAIGQVVVIPNPYRGNIDYNTYDPKWEKNPPGRHWMEQDRRIQFTNLPGLCKINIYTLAGDLIKILHHNDPEKGYEDWNLTSTVGQAISSGIYLFMVEDAENGQVQVGNFVVIK